MPEFLLNTFLSFDDALNDMSSLRQLLQFLFEVTRYHIIDRNNNTTALDYLSFHSSKQKRESRVSVVYSMNGRSAGEMRRFSAITTSRGNSTIF